MSGGKSITRTKSGTQKSYGKGKGKSSSSPLKAILIFVAIVLLLSYGEASGDPDMPSWSGLFSSLMQSTSVSSSDVIVHVIDVGQGDCTLVQSGKFNILIDAGENGYGTTVVEYLRSLKINHLDWIIATHPHSDHMGGIDTVIDEIDCDNIMMVYIPDEYSISSKFYLSVLESIEENDVTVTYADEGDIYKFGELTMEVLHPTFGEYRSDINDMSICLKFSCGDFGLITCGDITYEIEEELLDELHDLDADVFILNHHGSALSNSEEFITAISPDYAIISCGADNTYGHPHKSVIKLLSKLGISYFRTDRSGTVVISFVDDSIEIETEHNK